jgi:hypothetical protein
MTVTVAPATTKQPGRVLAINTLTGIPASGNTDILDVNVEDIDQLGIELYPTLQNIDGFIFYGRMHPDGSYQSVKSATWNTVGGLLLATSGDLAALAAAGTGFAVLDVRGFYSVKFAVSSAVDGLALSVRAIGKGHRV